MAEGHIYIYGEIVPFQDNEAANYGCVNLKGVVSDIKALGSVDEIKVHIHSPGGDVYEGFAIHDALKNSGKKITTIIEGLCASIATVIAFAGEDRVMTENSQFMIHNPWGMSVGDASELKNYAELLESEEIRLADFYASKTGLSTEDVRAMMKEETYMTPTEAKEKGFITNILTELKAVAKLNVNKMDNEFEKKANGLLAKLEDLFGKFSPKVKALVVTMAGDGEMVDFGEEVKEVADIAVGSPVKPADDNPLKDEYVMGDGTTLKIEGGKVSEIIPKAEEGGDDVEALKAEIEQLKADKAALESSNAEAEQTIQANAEKIETYEREMSGMKALATDMKDFMKKEKKEEPTAGSKVNREFLK